MVLTSASLLPCTCGIVSDSGCYISYLTDCDYGDPTLQGLKIKLKKRPVINGSFSKDKIGELNSIQQLKSLN